MGFSENLKRARLRVGLTQQQIADTLGITKSTYCGYETGKRQPDIAKLRRLVLLLCTSADELLSLGPDGAECTVTPQEYEQVLLFRRLDPHSQRLVRLVFEEEKARSQPLPAQPEGMQSFPVALAPFDGMEGAYLGPDVFRPVRVRRDALPAGAHFGLPVSGMSLEPRYHAGDVLIVSADIPQPGQTGVFLRGWSGYVRLMGYGELLSLNPAQPPLPLDAGVRPCGTVIGVLAQADIMD